MNKKISLFEGKEKISILAILFLFIIVTWTIMLYYFSPDEIVEYIGVKNGYLVVLIGGFLSGISIFFPFPNYLIVLTFGAGGLNPFLVGLSATMGVMLGESTSYFVGHTSHSFLPSNWHKRLHKFYLKLLKLRPEVTSLTLFLIGCIPLPNDIITIPLGLARYPFWRVIIPLGLGNLFYNIVLASVGYYGW